MKTTLPTIVLVTALALAACSPAAPQLAPRSDVAGEANAVVGVPAYAPEAAAGGLEFPSDALPAQSASAERLVIRNANLSIVVDDPAATADAITQLAEGMGGFVVSLNMYQTTYGPEARTARQANMTIRVPSKQLNEALSKIKAMAAEVKSESVSGQDVTAEYTDLQSRLTNLEAAERQLQSIMAEATKTEDVLAVYNRLVSVREQIEVIKGQIKYYEESAALSAITVDLIPNVATQPIQIGGWHPEGTAKRAIEDLVSILQVLGDGAIYFGITCLPFMLVIGLPAIFGLRYWLRRRKKGTPTQPTKPTG